MYTSKGEGISDKHELGFLDVYEKFLSGTPKTLKEAEAMLAEAKKALEYAENSSDLYAVGKAYSESSILKPPYDTYDTDGGQGMNNLAQIREMAKKRLQNARARVNELECLVRLYWQKKIKIDIDAEITKIRNIIDPKEKPQINS